MDSNDVSWKNSEKKHLINAGFPKGQAPFLRWDADNILSNYPFKYPPSDFNLKNKLWIWFVLTDRDLKSKALNHEVNYYDLYRVWNFLGLIFRLFFVKAA